MSVAVSPFELAAAEEISAPTEGLARLTAERHAGTTVAMETDERGPLRLRFPRMTSGQGLEAVIVNTGGGVVGGDRLRFEIEAGEAASVFVTSQAAEKIYRSRGPAAEISVRLTAAGRSALCWIPQETILFDRSRVARRIDVEMAPDASLTICEAVVFGRAAMGERVSCGLLRDHWRIRRDGKLVFAEALALDGAIGNVLAGPAVAGGAGAVATIVQASVAAESKIEALRRALRAWEAGASAFDGLLVVRLLANDGLALRSAILAALPALGMTPPRAFTL